MRSTLPRAALRARQRSLRTAVGEKPPPNVSWSSRLFVQCCARESCCKILSRRLQWCTCVSASARQSRAQCCAREFCCKILFLPRALHARQVDERAVGAELEQHPVLAPPRAARCTKVGALATGLAQLVDSLDALVQTAALRWCRMQRVANVKLIAESKFDDVFIAAGETKTSSASGCATSTSRRSRSASRSCS